MTKRGRPAQPSNVRQLSGDTRPSRQRAEAAAPESEYEWAEWLGDKDADVESVREIWNRVTRYLRSLKLQTEVDTDAVRVYVLAVYNMDRLGKVIAHAPAVIRDSNGQPAANPLMKEWQRAFETVRRIGSSFGMFGPGSRQLGAEGVVGSESRTDDLAG